MRDAFMDEKSCWDVFHVMVDEIYIKEVHIFYVGFLYLGMEDKLSSKAKQWIETPLHAKVSCHFILLHLGVYLIINIWWTNNVEISLGSAK